MNIVGKIVEVAGPAEAPERCEVIVADSFGLLVLRPDGRIGGLGADWQDSQIRLVPEGIDPGAQPITASRGINDKVADASATVITLSKERTVLQADLFDARADLTRALKRGDTLHEEAQEAAREIVKVISGLLGPGATLADAICAVRDHRFALADLLGHKGDQRPAREIVCSLAGALSNARELSANFESACLEHSGQRDKAVLQRDEAIKHAEALRAEVRQLADTVEELRSERDAAMLGRHDHLIVQSHAAQLLADRRAQRAQQNGPVPSTARNEVNVQFAAAREAPIGGRDAAIAEAQAQRDVAIVEAQAQRDAAIAEAQAQRDAAIAEAQAQRNAAIVEGLAAIAEARQKGAERDEAIRRRNAAFALQQRHRNDRDEAIARRDTVVAEMMQLRVEKEDLIAESAHTMTQHRARLSSTCEKLRHVLGLEGSDLEADVWAQRVVDELKKAHADLTRVTAQRDHAVEQRDQARQQAASMNAELEGQAEQLDKLLTELRNILGPRLR